MEKRREQNKNRYGTIPAALLSRFDDRLKTIFRYMWSKSALRRLTASRCAAKWQFTKQTIRSYTLILKPTPPCLNSCSQVNLINWRSQEKKNFIQETVPLTERMVLDRYLISVKPKCQFKITHFYSHWEHGRLDK